MATTNLVHLWKDGERLFVDVNGATVEARSFALKQEIVTLQFRARVRELKALTRHGADGGVPRIQNDPLYDESLW